MGTQRPRTALRFQARAAEIKAELSALRVGAAGVTLLLAKRARLVSVTGGGAAVLACTEVSAAFLLANSMVCLDDLAVNTLIALVTALLTGGATR